MKEFWRSSSVLTFVMSVILFMVAAGSAPAQGLPLPRIGGDITPPRIGNGDTSGLPEQREISPCITAPNGPLIFPIAYRGDQTLGSITAHRAGAGTRVLELGLDAATNRICLDGRDITDAFWSYNNARRTNVFNNVRRGTYAACRVSNETFSTPKELVRGYIHCRTISSQRPSSF